MGSRAEWGSRAEEMECAEGAELWKAEYQNAGRPWIGQEGAAGFPSVLPHGSMAWQDPECEPQQEEPF